MASIIICRLYKRAASLPVVVPRLMSTESYAEVADAILNTIAKRSFLPPLERYHVIILFNAHLRARRPSPTQLLFFPVESHEF